MLSVSDLCGYSFCKRKLYIEKVLGIREPVKPQLTLGSVRHAVYENLSRQEKSLISSVQKPDEQHISSLFTASYSSGLRNALIAFRADLQRFRIDLSQAFRDIWPKLSEDARARALAVFRVAEKEHAVGQKLWDVFFPKIESEKWVSSEQLGVRGIVDRIEIWPDHLLPVELKTGKMPMEGVWHTHRLQIACYMLLVSAEKHADVRRGVVEYLDHRERREVVYNPFMKEEIIQLRDKVRELFASKEIPGPCGKDFCLFCRRSELPPGIDEMRNYFSEVFAHQETQKNQEPRPEGRGMS